MSGSSYFGNQQTGFWLLVADQNGDELWQRIYSEERYTGVNNRAMSLIQDDEGGFVLGGKIHDEQDYWFSVLRTDAEGERLWWRNYGVPGWAGECEAVIELKAGEFVAVGRNGDFQAYAVMLNGDGDLLWGNFYDEGMWFHAVREVAGGLLMSGYDINRDAWLFKTNFEGEFIWSRSFERGQLISLISCRDGGFAASGSRSGENGGWLLLRTDDNGNELWSRTFDFGGRESSSCLVQMWDNGFTMVGNAIDASGSAIIRTDAAGNEQWRRIDRFERERLINGFKSVTLAREGAAVVAGAGILQDDDRSSDGVLIKVALMVSPPSIVFFSPDEPELTVLQGDSIRFIVQAEDMQDDSLSYYWTLNEDTVAIDTSTTIIFEELADHIIECFVADGEFADSVQWIVHVEEFFIRSFEPESLELIIQRGTEIDFRIDVAALEEIETENSWNLTYRDQRQEEIGNEDAVSITFDQSGRHQLQAHISHEDESDEVTWTINVRSAIWSWWPSEPELTAYVDSTLEFIITPFNEESDSLAYVWLLDDEQLESDSTTVSVTFPQTGHFEITSIVHDGNEADTIRWAVDVEEWSFTTDETDLTDFPTSPVLYPACPNPFNSSVKLSMYLPQEENVLLSIFDINGREVVRLIHGDVSKGNQTFVWNANNFPAGVYVVRMEVGNMSEMRKIVLVR